ncbi:hypothetical protein THAOC_22553, partial [Thalassiosira oceanica]
MAFFGSSGVGAKPPKPKEKEKKKEEEEERRERRRRRETTYQQSKRHCLGGNEFTPGSMQQIRTARRAEPSVMRIEPGRRRFAHIILPLISVAAASSEEAQPE